MALPTHVLLMYGYLLLLAWVVEQIGIPLPATPIILAAGALSAEGHSAFLSLCSLALPRRSSPTHLVPDRPPLRSPRPAHSLQALARTDDCVRKTQDSFGRRRDVTLMIAKFVPGLATLARQSPAKTAWDPAISVL